MNRHAIIFAAGAALLGSISSAQAVLISADFIRTTAAAGTTTPVSGDTAATGNVKNADGLIFTGQVGAWNALNVGPQGNFSHPSFTSQLLNDAVGNPTSVRFQILPTNLPSPQQSAYRAGASTVNTSVPNLRFEFASIHTALNVPPFMNWLITGLDPETLVDLTIFGGAAEPAAQHNVGATMVANGIAATKDSEADFNWTGLTNAAGEIQIRIEIPTTGGAQSRYFGFQLQTRAVDVPEPATVSLGALGLAVLAFRRRRTT